jgi:hypothetical protein
LQGRIQMSADLLRQRRNFIAVSLLLCFLTFAKVEPDKIAFLGTEFSNFGNPEAVTTTIWFVWLYFLVRYIQYFSQEGLTNFLDVFSQIFAELSSAKIEKIVKSKYPKDFRDNCSYYTLKEWDWTYHGQEQFTEPDTGITKTNNFQMQISPKALWQELLYSLVKVIFFRSAFTDYILPFLIGLGAVIYAGDYHFRK